MTTKPHTITEEKQDFLAIALFLKQWLKERDIDMGFTDTNIGQLAIEIQRNIKQALHRKDEEWKEKVKSLRMENMRWCPRCKRDSERNGFTLHSDCPHPELMYRNQAIDEFNKKVDELLK